MNRRLEFFFGLAMAAATASPAAAELWAVDIDSNHTAPDPEHYNRVLRLAPDGTEVNGGIAHGSNGLALPTAVAVGPDGNVYVSDAGTGRILKYDGHTGQPVAQNGGVFAQLATAAPAQLAFGPNGNLYVSEFFGTNVEVYDPSGTRLADAVTGLTSAGGLAFAANGDLLVGDGFVTALGQTAQIVRVHNGVKSTFGVTNGGMLSSPVALQVLGNGDLLAADLLGNYVARFDSNGQNFQPFAFIPPAIPNPLPAGAQVPSNNPSGIRLDPDGNVIVSVLGLTNPPDDRGALLRYDLNGNLLETIKTGLHPIGAIDWSPSSTTLMGNYNGTDISVDQLDYEKWKADFGKLVAKGNGADGNADGIVDAADYTVWRDHLGNGGIEMGGSGVPEPASAALLVLGGALALAARMAGRRNRFAARS